MGDEVRDGISVSVGWLPVVEIIPPLLATVGLEEFSDSLSAEQKAFLFGAATMRSCWLGSSVAVLVADPVNFMPIATVTNGGEVYLPGELDWRR